MKKLITIQDTRCSISNHRYRVTLTFNEKPNFHRVLGALEETREVTYDEGEDATSSN